MRSFRSIAVLGILFIGLVAYLYFVDSKKPVDQTEEKAKVFAGVEADKIVAHGVTIRSGAFFSFVDNGNTVLSIGTSFTAISNAAAQNAIAHVAMISLVASMTLCPWVMPSSTERTESRSSPEPSSERVVSPVRSI